MYRVSATIHECPTYEKDKHTRLEVMLVSECSFRLSFGNGDLRVVSNGTSSQPFVQAHNKLLDSTVLLETLRPLHSTLTTTCAYFA